MRRKIDLVILLLVLISGFFALQNAQSIGDWWHASRYDPPSEIEQLAGDAGMSEIGKKLFFRFSPRLVSQAELDQVCNVEKLGCVEGRTLYLLKYENNDQYNRTIVTAAHEMLHVAYSRLGAREREEVDDLLEAELDIAQTSDIIKKLQGYPEADYFNEAHSFIGSELPKLSDDLAAYYQRYFADRSKSVRAYANSPEAL